MHFQPYHIVDQIEIEIFVRIIAIGRFAKIVQHYNKFKKLQTSHKHHNVTDIDLDYAGLN